MPLRPFRRRQPKTATSRPITGVIGASLDVKPPAVRSWEERLAEMETADPEGARYGGMTLEHPDELVPYIDVEPSYARGYDWSVGLYEEIRLFVDDDALGNAEGADVFESRFSSSPGISAAMREDREVVHVATDTLTAPQLHALAVQVVADAARATRALKDQR